MGVGIDCEIEESLQRAKAERIWRRVLNSFGMPAWFSADVVELFRDYLLRDPNDVAIRQRVVAKKKKRKALPRDLVDLASVECRELVIQNAMRFYLCSPAQFAAAVFASGRVLGTYASRRHRVGEVKGAYEKLRESTLH